MPASMSPSFICDEFQTADDYSEEVSDSIIEKIEAGLQNALKGRYWAGKEAVLKATVSLAKLSPELFKEKMGCH